jgi:glutamine synthetase
VDLYTADESVTKTLAALPGSLDKAIALAENSSFIKKVLGEELLLKYLAAKKQEAGDFAAAKDKEKFYKERYFDIV